MKKTLLSFALTGLCFSAMAQWSDNASVNTRLSKEGYNVYDSEISTSKDGNTYFCYSSPQGVDKAINTYLQIIDKTGKKIFENDVLISNYPSRSYTMINQRLLVDKNGNAIISVSDKRNAENGSESLSYNIYKISPSGEKLWGEDGVDLTEGKAFNIVADMKMIELEDGSYVLAWMECLAEGDPLYIKLMRLNGADGSFLWDEPITLKDGEIPYTFPFINNAGKNEFYLTYSKGSGKEILTRKIDFEGNSVWAEDTRVYRGGFPDGVPLYIFINTQTDPNGGLFIGWYDDRAFTNTESTYASYIKPDGSYGFAAGVEGQKLGYSGLRGFLPEMIYEKSENSIYAVWRETNSNQSQQGLKAQKLSMEGDLLWDAAGLEIVPLHAGALGFYSLKNANDGEFAIFYLAPKNTTTDVYGKTEGFASLFSAVDGKSIWGKWTTITKDMGEKGGLMVGDFACDQWVTAWSDSRDVELSQGENKGSATYGQNVTIKGNLGNDNKGLQGLEADISFNVSPSAISNMATFSFVNTSTSQVSLNIYNAAGQKISELCNDRLESGTYSYNWSVSNMPQGLYFATLKNNQQSKVLKVIVK